MKILPNRRVQYHTNLLKALDTQYSLDHQVQLHTFWSGKFGIKQLIALKSIFVSQKSYDYVVNLWVGEEFTIDDEISQKYQEFITRFHKKICVKKFILKDEVLQQSSGLVNINTNYLGGKVGLSDVVRIALLYKYGGLWFDMDFIFLRDIKPLLSYRNFIAPWGFYRQSANGLIYIDKPQNVTITQIVKRCIESKSCHSKKVFPFTIRYDDLYVLPCYSVYPLWMGCIRNVPIQGFCNCYNIFQPCKTKVQYKSIFPSSYMIHWHNKWNHSIHKLSVFNQLAQQIESYLLNSHTSSQEIDDTVNVVSS